MAGSMAATRPPLERSALSSPRLRRIVTGSRLLKTIRRDDFGSDDIAPRYPFEPMGAGMQRDANLDLAVIGNCTWAGLVDDRARLVWGCLPRFDSDPVFPALVDGAIGDEGVFAIDLLDFARSERHYDGNTAILRTILTDDHGSAVEILDFAPRFAQFGRTYRPTMMMRRVSPIAGEPRIRVVLTPRSNYGREPAQTARGSNHIRYMTSGITLRLTTDAPISYVADQTAFVLGQPIHLILGPDESFRDPIESTVREYEDRTRAHWTEWVRGLSIPFEWQEEVIRAAITLQLCYFEETGAIVAALTTSIPEHEGSERNWDYRFCWLRDAYFVIHAGRSPAGLRDRAGGRARRALRAPARGLPGKRAGAGREPGVRAHPERRLRLGRARRDPVLLRRASAPARRRAPLPTARARR
jgi:hypothetical protein